MDSPETFAERAEQSPPTFIADIVEGQAASAASDFDYLRCLHEHLPIMLYYSSYKDGRWVIRYVSPVIRDVLGYKPEEVVGRFSWADLSPGGDDSDRPWPEKGRGRQSYRQTLMLRSASGEIKAFSDNGVVIYDRTGRLKASVGAYLTLTGPSEPSALAETPLTSPAVEGPAKNGPGRTDLLRALGLNLWNITRTADYLGWSRATIYRKMKQWRLKRPLPLRKEG